MDCLFCRIAAGELPAERVYEDDKIVAFRDISPQAPVHILVIPRAHIASVEEITPENCDIVGYIFAHLPEIAAKAGLKNGYRVITNCGEDACQSVKHLHFHLIGGRRLAERMV